MKQHKFLFSPMNWFGEGTIQFSMLEEELDFLTRWTIITTENGTVMEAKQEVEVKGVPENIENNFILSNFKHNRFAIELDNVALGRVSGKGVVRDHLIAWEFRNTGLEFEGFESYELQKDDGSYVMRAEYATPDQMRTTIKGRIWQRKSTIV